MPNDLNNERLSEHRFPVIEVIENTVIGPVIVIIVWFIVQFFRTFLNAARFFRA